MFQLFFTLLIGLFTIALIKCSFRLYIQLFIYFFLSDSYLLSVFHEPVKHTQAQ